MTQRACPKCGHEQPEYHTECAQCGIVFSKYTEEYDSFARAQASTTLQPRPARVRPLTLVLLLAYLGLGWYAIEYYEITDKLVLLRGAEEGISSGGSFNLRKRSRVEIPAVQAVEGAEGEAAPAVYAGLPVFADATLISDRTAVSDEAGHALYETGESLDAVMAYYQGLLGEARVIRTAIEVPADSPIASTLGEVRCRRVQWSVRTVGADGVAHDVDVELQTPFFDAAGSFHPDATLIALTDHMPPPPTE